MSEIRESRKIVNADIETWHEKDFKYEVRATYQERILVNGLVKEFITHYEVLSQVTLKK